MSPDPTPPVPERDGWPEDGVRDETYSAPPVPGEKRIAPWPSVWAENRKLRAELDALREQLDAAVGARDHASSDAYERGFRAGKDAFRGEVERLREALKCLAEADHRFAGTHAMASIARAALSSTEGGSHGVANADS